MPTAVVTGAAGFIGARVSRALRERDWQVTGVDLREGPGIVVGDIIRDGDWTDELSGADLVVHTAAVVDENAPVEAHRRVNVGGTRHVLERAAAAGVGRLVHLSSIVVLGNDFVDGVDETGEVSPTGSPYTDTKIAAEHQALLAAASGGLDVTVVRPGDVYGPGGTQWTVRPVELLRAGRAVLPESGRGILSPIYVDDLADGIVAAATHDAAVGEVFHLTGGEGVETRRFFGYYAEMLDVPLRTVALPGRVVTRVLKPAGAVARALDYDLGVSAHTVEYLTHPGTYSIDKARAVLDWQPSTDLDRGMAHTRDWLTDQGMLDDLPTETTTGT